MKFSAETISILNNFAKINQSILFSPGSTLSTISPNKTILARANIKEEIPDEAAVYDLGIFLASLNLMQDYDISFDKDRFVIKSGKSVLRYTYAAKSMLVLPPASGINMPSKDAQFELKWKELDGIIRAASILKISEIKFTGSEDGVTVSAIDSKNPTSDQFKLDVSSEANSSFNVVVKLEHMKFLPLDYNITVSQKGLVHFESPLVQYWLAAEAK